MTRVVIYPNNSVEVDGRTFHWPDEEFERYGIPKVRLVRGKAGSAEHRRVDGMHLVIFPTKEIGGERGVVRANAGTLEQSCEVCGKPCRVKYCIEHGLAKERERHEAVRRRKEKAKAAKLPRVRRKYYYDKFGRLYLWCAMCQSMLPEDDFYRDQSRSFGRYGYCKVDWNRYMSNRSNRDAKGGTQTVHQDPPQHRP